MRVKFADDVLNDPNSSRLLDRIVDLFFEGRHLWEIDDRDAIKTSSWIQSDKDGRAGSAANPEAFKKCYTDAIYLTPGRRTHSLLIIVTNANASQTDLSPDDARRCLESPVSVLVENSQSDGAFLDAMIYGLSRQELCDAQTEGWWQYEHLGGFGNVEARIAEILSRTSGPIRLFVLVDSDALFPGQVTATERKVAKSCQAEDVPYAILRKRKSENYLPIAALQNSGRRTQVSSLCRLSPEQRDHYEMKGGFRTDPTSGQAIVPKPQRDLFADTSQFDLDRLRGGFGSNVWQLFKDARTKITEDAIRETCQSCPDEIDGILNKIERLI